MSRPVEVAPYDPLWPQVFQELRSRIMDCLGHLALSIDHVGSTAVPGCWAKPIIDMDVVVKDKDDVQTAIDLLGQLGYVHQGDKGIPGREAFEPPQGWPPHHLYVLVRGAQEHGRHLRFRNLLRRNPALVEEYSRLKRHLARQMGSDRVAYTEGKTDFIQDCLTRAGE